ncbi:MAG: ribosome biogenesis GTPase Der, partial [Chlorobi bacterium]|nr:ribosome biogenesis GTPase Der [Chlorobiota bacterium]
VGDCCFRVKSKTETASGIREQVEISIREADLVIFVVDGKAGIHPMDEEIARILRKRTDKVILAVNKIDSEKVELETGQFYAIGLGEPHSISAVTGRKIGDFLDEVVAVLPKREARNEDPRMRLAVIGRPNVGKSSLVNALIGEERALVTEIAGTTRDPIDSVLKYHGEEIVLIDTAGLRRKSKVKENIEFYSTLRTMRSIERCDVTLVLLDAQSQLTHQDADIIEEVVKRRKGIVLAVNKWDLVEKDTGTTREFEQAIFDHLKMFDYIPVVFISALTKQRISKAIALSREVFEQRNRRIPTSELNAQLRPYIEATPPPTTPTGREIKISFITQVRTAPPVFLFFTNEPKHLPESYRRFLERRLRKEFGFKGVPLTLQFRKK